MTGQGGVTPAAQVARALRTVPATLATAFWSGLAVAQGAAPQGAPPVEDIRDIRGAKLIIPLWLVLAAVVAALLFVAGAVFLWRRWRRPRRAPDLLPWEIAIQRLEAMRSLMHPGQAREFSIAVSDVVRGYIEQRFAIVATHRTTEEFLHDLLETTNAALTDQRALLSEFLSQCDLVKFAGESLTVQSMETLHHSARAFVLATKEAHDPLPAA